MFIKNFVVFLLIILCSINFTFAQSDLPKPARTTGFGNVTDKLINPSGSGLISKDITDDSGNIFDGIWESKGYGYLLNISENNFELFNVTKVSRIKLAAGQIINDQIEIPGIGSLMLLRLGDSLGVQNITGKTIYSCKIDSIPQPGITDWTSDPVASFEVFWNSFEENCILFPVTSFDWKAQYNQYRPQVNSNTTDEELFNIFCKMLAPLNDRHTGLIDYNNLKEYTPGSVEYQWWDLKREKIIEVISTYFNNNKIESAGSGNMFYGKINGTYGYMNFSQFAQLIDGVPYQEDEAFIKAVLDSLIMTFKDTKAIIVDIRANRGGYDKFALELASRFNDQLRISHYKQVRNGGYSDFSKPEPVLLNTNRISYTGKPVILLTSRYTISAADVCSMAFDQIPNVTIIGENTRGMFSDIHDVTLPNGWVVSMSNERYTTVNGEFLEQIGIAPDIYIKGDSSAFNEGRDEMLEKAIEHLNQLTGVEKELKNTFSYKLESNYPNPFNPETVISYQLPVNSHVELKVYDLLGKEVTTLINQEKSAGSYSVKYNAGCLSSGIYIYRLTANSLKTGEQFVKSAKMTLIK